MKNKKSLIAIIIILIVGVGATFAYFYTSSTYDNDFDVGDYNVETKELFVSPDEWSPGDTVNKSFKVKNKGTMPIAVRVAYNTEWVDATGGVITVPNDAVSINFSNNYKWIRQYSYGDYYYYYIYALNQGDEVEPFIESVTLNSNLNETTCGTTDGDRVCKTKYTSYGMDGGQYRISIKIETIPYSRVSNWHTEQDLQIIEKKEGIFLPEGKTANNLEYGDEVCVYKDTRECFKVLGYDGDDVILFSKYPLLINTDRDFQGKRGVQSSIIANYNGYSATFSTNAYWLDSESNLKSQYGTSFPAYVYDSNYTAASGDNYSVAYYVENYKNELINNYNFPAKSARLLKLDELLDHADCRLISSSSEPYYSCGSNSTFGNDYYWLGDVYDAEGKIWVASKRYVSLYKYDYNSYSNSKHVRPVIIVDKNDLIGA